MKSYIQSNLESVSHLNQQSLLENYCYGGHKSAKGRIFLASAEVLAHTDCHLRLNSTIHGIQNHPKSWAKRPIAGQNVPNKNFQGSNVAGLASPSCCKNGQKKSKGRDPEWMDAGMAMVSAWA